MKRFLWLLLMWSLASPVFAQAPQPNQGIGGTSLTALLIENQRKIDAEMSTAAGLPANSPTNPIDHYSRLYDLTHGGPVSQWLGLPLTQITNNASFQVMYWLVVLLSGAFCSMSALASLSPHGPIHSSEDYRHTLSKFILKLFVGAVIVAQPNLVYGIVMTVRDSFTSVVASIVSSSPAAAAAIQNTIGTGNLDAVNFDVMRDRAIQRAIDERIAITQTAPSANDRKEMGRLLNAMAASVNSALNQERVPIAPDDVINASNGTVHLRLMAEQFNAIFWGLASLHQPREITASYNGANIPVQTAGALIFNPDAAPQKTRLAAEALPHTADNRTTLDTLAARYESEVLRAMKDIIDMDMGRLMQNSPQQGFYGHAYDVVAQRVEDAVSLPTRIVQEVMQWIINVVNMALAYVIARGAAIGLGLMIELNVFLVVVCMPLWLVPATPRAFTFLVRSLFNAAIVMPAFQLVMFVTDAIFAKILHAAVVAETGAAVVSLGTGAAPLLAIALGYIVFYTATVLILLWKTPKMLNALFTGTGAVSAYMGAMATGALAGAMTTVGVGAAPLMAAGGAAGGAIAGKTGAMAASAGSSIARHAPARVRAAARLASYRTRSAYASLPRPVQRASASAGRAARRAFSLTPIGVAPSPAPVSPARPVASAPAAAAPVAASVPAPKPLHPSIATPIRFAVKTAAREAAAAAVSDDPGDYLRRRTSPKVV